DDQRDTGEPTIHAQGTAVLRPAPAEAHEDLSASADQTEAAFPGSVCYQAFTAIGFDYGPAHQALQHVVVGTDASGQRRVIADVHLPSIVAGTSDAYVLHPSILDAALQATIGFGLAAGMRGAQRGSGGMPFALDGLTILGPCPPVARVVVRDGART